MSFSHFEKALIALRRSDEWHEDVQTEVKRRYDEAFAHKIGTSVFITDPTFQYPTAFVPYFNVSQLEYLLLSNLNALCPPTEDQTRRLQAEFQSVYENQERSAEEQRFHDKHSAKFGNFSAIIVVDMEKLKQCNLLVYYLFYKFFYLPALVNCSRQADATLNKEMQHVEQKILTTEAQSARVIAEITTANAGRNSATQQNSAQKRRVASGSNAAHGRPLEPMQPAAVEPKSVQHWPPELPETLPERFPRAWRPEDFGVLVKNEPYKGPQRPQTAPPRPQTAPARRRPTPVTLRNPYAIFLADMRSG